MWNYGDWGWMNYGMHGWGMILFWGLIFFAVFALVRSVATPAVAPARQPEDALGILRERYARGELSRNEFQTMQEHLDAG